MDRYNNPVWRVIITTLATGIAILLSPMYIPLIGLIAGYSIKWALPASWSTYVGLTSDQLPLVFAAVALSFYSLYVGLTIYKTKNWENNDFDEFKGGE